MSSINILKLSDGDILLLNKREVSDRDAGQLVGECDRVHPGKSIGIVFLDNIDIGKIKGCTIKEFMEELKKERAK